MKLNEFKDMSSERQYNSLRRTLQGMGYTFYENVNYNLNIINIRNSKDLHSTKFNDLVAVAYLVGGIKTVDVYEATTDPGRTYRISPINRKGTAVMLPQQIKGGLKLGLHKGYEALVQTKFVYVLRDDDKNVEIPTLALLTLDEIKSIYKVDSTGKFNYIHSADGETTVCKLEYGMFGINEHRASKWKILEHIGLYSAGCIVHRNPYEYRNKFIPIIKRSIKLYGNSFTRTLITSDKLK